ncbi:MurR/RpiR family transcriptional regulator [Streptomonospora nanhaiensis]|uniref:DNA-binding MurR/RpiR family transcriptional regulator n=1 Tax=Streptomonospora nanhaiensis TaxID=1323731 RepID=A0A853BS46_9ACTN|nr:MurR/RpiR family transcriptional regulator [Streptomonospora nanhaiensis]NYI97321.1 DNA-binding MurR/RpiR family transcriptional regulator [Streptomonospora nanhaiensis]
MSGGPDGPGDEGKDGGGGGAAAGHGAEDGGFRARVTARLARLSPRERAVTDFLLNRPAEAVTASAAQLAAMTGTSDATVVRTARSLGYSGLRELKRSVLDMLTARRDPALVLDQRLEGLGGAPVLERVIADSADLLRRLPDVLDASAFAAAVEAMAGAERVVAYGIGPASATARYLAIEVGRLGRRSRAVEASGFRLADDLLDIGAGDVVVVVAPLRLFREIEALLDHCAEAGAEVVVITEALGPAVRGRVRTVLVTPPSTAGAADENFAPWLVAHALTMDLAARDRSGSVAARQRLNRLRAAIAGTEIDVDVVSPAPSGQPPRGGA